MVEHISGFSICVLKWGWGAPNKLVMYKVSNSVKWQKCLLVWHASCFRNRGRCNNHSNTVITVQRHSWCWLCTTCATEIIFMQNGKRNPGSCLRSWPIGLWSGCDCQIVSCGKLQKLLAAAHQFPRQKGVCWGRGFSCCSMICQVLSLRLTDTLKTVVYLKELGRTTSEDRSIYSCSEQPHLKACQMKADMERGVILLRYVDNSDIFRVNFTVTVQMKSDWRCETSLIERLKPCIF